MTDNPAPRFGKGKPAWSTTEDARLLEITAAAPVKGDAAWREVAAKNFPGRSPNAVQQRVVTLRNKAKGIDRDYSHSDWRLKERAVGTAAAQIAAASAAQHTTLTAFLCGDPLPGRSALDKLRSAGA